MEMGEDIGAVSPEIQLPYRVEQMGKQQSESQRKQFTKELQRQITLKRKQAKNSLPSEKAGITDDQREEERKGKEREEEKKGVKGQSDFPEKKGEIETRKTGLIIDVKV